jgi:hypothetical protein
LETHQHRQTAWVKGQALQAEVNLNLTIDNLLKNAVVSNDDTHSDGTAPSICHIDEPDVSTFKVILNYFALECFQQNTKYFFNRKIFFIAQKY